MSSVGLRCGLLGAAMAALLVSGESRAYVRARTNPPASLPLRWGTNPVPYLLDAAGSKDLPPGAVHAAARKAFATWEAVPCAYITFREEGVRAGQRVEYKRSGPNVNAVVWLESNWIRERNAIAYTTVTANQLTGEILDADISLNGVDYVFSSSDGAEPGKVDVQSILTHEVGHFLGLDHSPVPGATMQSAVGIGDISVRDLEQDDIDGVCAIYPPGSEPRPPSGGCDTITGGSPWEGVVPLALLGGWIASRKRRRPAKAAPTDLR